METLIVLMFTGLAIFTVAELLIIIRYHNSSKNSSPKEENFKQFYHCCRYCLHSTVKGIYSDPKGLPDLYCVHPDAVKSFSNISTVPHSFMCGKWELKENMETELFKFHSERILESSIRAVKNQKQDKLHRK